MGQHPKSQVPVIGFQEEKEKGIENLFKEVAGTVAHACNPSTLGG